MKPDPVVIKPMMELGVSPFIMTSTESLVGFVLNGTLSKFGDIYVSALTVMQSAMMMVSVPLGGFGQGTIPVISYNYGHGNTKRVRDSSMITLAVMFIVNLILFVLMILFPGTVASLFTQDQKLISVVAQYMPLFLLGMTIFGMQRACQNTFVALGQAGTSLFIALLRKVFLLIPLSLILPMFMGVSGVYAGEAIADATAAICCMTIFTVKFPKILKRMGNK
jgi:Na+-driven multidrug efflux pump